MTSTLAPVKETWSRLPEAVRVVLALFPDIAGASSSVSQVAISPWMRALTAS